MKRIADRETHAAIDLAASDWIVRRSCGLSDEEQGAYAAWRAADPRHATALDQLEQAWTFMDRPRAVGQADEMANALRSRATGRRRRRLGLATAAVIAFVATSTIWQSRHSLDIEHLPVSAMVLRPEKQTLPDGTIVELKRGAEVVADFAGPLRRVLLRRGEALFHVAKDPHRPFIVTAGEVEVRAVGTAFAVQIKESGVEVVVTEGRVAVEKAKNGVVPHLNSGLEPAPLRSVVPTLVDAGERINVDSVSDAAAPQPIAITLDEIANRLSWRATRIEFSHTPLAEAVALMNQHAKLQLVVDDSQLATVRVNGIFRADNTETLIRLLEASFGIETTRSGNTVLLRQAR